MKTHKIGQDSSSTSFPTNVWKSLSKIEYGEVFLFIFLLITVRQYLWIVPDNLVSWGVASTIAISLLYIHLQCKESLPCEGQSSGLFFSFFIIMPFLILFLMRAFIPDSLGDVIDYHVTNGDRTLKGFPYIVFDYFPYGGTMPTSLADMFTAVFRNILGYRAGTLGNYLVFLWIAVIAEKFLRKVVIKSGKRYLLLFLVLSCEYVLFEINSYMVDLLGVPLLLEATWVLYNFETFRNKDYPLLYVSLLLGLSFALKLTNLVYIIPLSFWAGILILRSKKNLSFRSILFCFAVFLLPIAPHAIFMYIQTANPVFPYYNAVFHSPYWPLANLSDPRWGPKTIIETLFWPVSGFFMPDRLSELQIYSGRIALTFLLSLPAFVWAEKKTQVIIALWLCGVFLWSIFGIGYIRYGLYSEILGGIIIIQILFQSRADAKQVSIIIMRWAFIIILSLQCFFAYKYYYAFDWSQRPNIFQNPRLHLENLKYMFRDRFLYELLSLHDKEVVRRADVWAVACCNTGHMSLLKNNIPIIRLESSSSLDTQKGLEKFVRTFEQLKDRRIITICPAENLECCMSSIKERGLGIYDKDFMTIPFFGYKDIPAYAFELRLGEEVSRTASRLIYFPGKLVSSPALAWNPTAREQQMVVRGADDTLWTSSFGADGVFRNDWAKIPGKTSSAPALAWNSAAGKLQMAVRGADDAVATASFGRDGRFNNNWKTLPRRTVESPALIWNSLSKQLDMIVKSSDDSLWLTTLNKEGNSIHNWHRIPWTSVLLPAVFYNPARETYHVITAERDNFLVLRDSCQQHE